MDKLETILTGATYKGPGKCKAHSFSWAPTSQAWSLWEPALRSKCLSAGSTFPLRLCHPPGPALLCREASPSATRMFSSQLWVHTPPLPGGTHPVGTPLPRWSRVPSHGLARWWCSGIAIMIPAHSHPSLHLIFLAMPAQAPSSLVRDCVLWTWCRGSGGAQPFPPVEQAGGPPGKEEHWQALGAPGLGPADLVSPAPLHSGPHCVGDAVSLTWVEKCKTWAASS